MRTQSEAAPPAPASRSVSSATSGVAILRAPLPAAGSPAAHRATRAARRVLSGVAVAILLGCSAMPMSPGTARADVSADAAAERDFDGDLMFELMIAELAGRRGQLDVATERYLAAAMRSDDPRVADRAARLAMFGRRWADAERAARRWIELDDAARDAREVLARALLSQDEGEAAAAEYVALVAMVPAADEGADDEALADGAATGSADEAPPLTRAEVLRGLIASLREERPERAGTVLEALAEAYPDEAEAQLGVARLALAANDRDAALAAVERALAAEPGNVDAQLLRARVLLASGRADDAFDGLEAALEADPDDVQLALGRARLLAEAEREEEAFAEFERLHELAPEDGDVLLTIGLLALEAGRVEPARRYLESLLASGAHADQANFYLARIDDDARDRASAISHYEAVGPGPLYADARLRAAELVALEGDLAGGRARLERLAQELPDPNFAPRLLVAESRMLQQAGDPEEAVSVLSEGLEEYPENADLLYARALAADGAGDPDTLESDLYRLIEMDPDNAHALNALGYHFADGDRRLEEAETYLEKAVALEPDDAAILDSLGWLRYRQGRFAEAEELLRRAYALYPDGEIAAHLGEVLWVQGEREEARAVWNAALEETPDDEVLLRVVKKFASE